MNLIINITPQISQDAISNIAFSDSVQRCEAVVSAYAEHFQSYPWTHYCHLSFRFEQSDQSAEKHFLRLVRRLEQRAQRKVGYFGAVERGELLTERAHIHAVVAGCEALSPDVIGEMWMEHGLSDISRYDGGQGGLAYLAKTLYQPSSSLLLSAP